jgi:hypothetical protein
MVMANVGVAQALADDLGGHAGRQRGGRVAVAHVVESDLREAGIVGLLLEPAGEPLRVQLAAVRPGEYQP